MKPIPVDNNDFPEICHKGQIYVDKTAYLYRLITDPNCSSFFVSRPRRFGKSLMISTIKAIFQGRKELFNGLSIAATDYAWKVHPVIHFNMGFCATANYEDFRKNLPEEIKRGLREAGCVYNQAESYSQNLGEAIDTLYAKGNPPVILIDEYDDPVAKVIQDAKMAEKVRDDLAAIYGQLKDRSGKIRFLLITGVSKFTKLSVFSALSSLKDISFDDKYATMFGFTEAELDTYYGEYMTAQAEIMHLALDAYRAELKRMYNGYRFGRLKEETVYNPVSINSNLADCEPIFLCSWSETGRPSMLMNFLKREQLLTIDPEKLTYAIYSDFDVADLSYINPKGLLFQTGYLTIQDFNRLSQVYTLRVPDEEVRQDLACLIASQCANQTGSWARSVGSSVLTGDWSSFFLGLKSLYAGVAYGPKENRICEYSYGRCLSFLLQGQGIVCQQEVTQSDGRVDMVCTHPCGIYIFELKVNQPAAIAMDQIQRKNYALPYAADSRPVWLIGLSFNSKTRQLADALVESYSLISHPLR